MKRRDFLVAGTLTLLGCARKAAAPLPPGELLGPSHALGHRLRHGGGFPVARETRQVDALVAGGGMAGLACGWWLARSGHDDFAVLELEQEAGGNSRAGQNTASAYPWGAHYLPLPGPDARELRRMLADFDALRGDPDVAHPEYEERHLCHAPQERLHINGVWQDGLLPQFGIPAAERAQQRRFIERMAILATNRDAHDRRAFTIPSARGGSPDPALAASSMHDWLMREGFDAPSLHWWVNYACRDDYGTDYRQVSAWAGIHYFAGRHGQTANAEAADVLTWPEGNAWLTRRLAGRLGERLVTGALVWRIEADDGGIDAMVFLPGEGRSVRYRAERLVWAGPAGVLPHVWPALPATLRAAASRIEYAPWLVANLTLRAPPHDRNQAPLSWDNVLYQSQGLGYVVATHQRLARDRRDTVITYYRPLSEHAPAAARALLLATPRETWARQILTELGRVHPELAGLCTRLDIWRWGHAMVRPTPGMFGGALEILRRPAGRVMLAHGDLSGFSLAEEAHYWGVRAAHWLITGEETLA